MASTIPGFSGSPTLANHGETQINGTRVTVEETVDATGIGFYRMHATDQEAPSSLAIWKDTGGGSSTLLGSVPTVVDDGSVNWQDSPLSAPITLEPGFTYHVTGCHPGNGEYALTAYANLTAPDYPFTITGAGGYYTIGSCAAPPVNNIGNVVLIRLLSGDLPPDPDEGVTNFSLENALSRWFASTGDNTRQEHLPWQTHVLAGEIQDTVDSPTHGLAVIKGVADTMLNAIEAAMGPGGNLITGTLRPILDAMVADLEAHMSAERATITTAITAAADNVIATVNGPPAMLPIPGAGWTKTAEITGTGPKVWDEPADRYVLVIDDWAPSRHWEDIDGLPYFGHRGWWAPLNGDHVGHYNTMVGRKHELYEVGARLNGVVIWLEPDLEWTLEAWEWSP